MTYTLPGYDAWKLATPPRYEDDSGCDHYYDDFGVCVDCGDDAEVCCDAGRIGHRGRHWREDWKDD